MRIAIFSDTFYPQVNGVVSVVFQNAKALIKLGHEVCLVSVSKYSKNELEKLEKRINFINLPSLPFWGYKGERVAAPIGWSLKKVKKFNPDIIHSHTPFSVGFEAILCSKILKTPLIGTHHTFYDHYLKHIHLDYAWAKTFSWKYFVSYYNRCSLILSPSNALAQELIEQGLEPPVEVIFNPVDLSMFHPLGDSAKKISLKAKYGISGPSCVYMGRLSYEKNLDMLLRSFSLAVKIHKDIKMMLIGDGPEKARLESLGRQLKIDANLIFTGYLKGENLAEALHANEIFVTASNSENMPISILEAMASGLPVIAPESKGIPEIVKSGFNGLLIEPDNQIKMADEMINLINNSPERERLGNAAFEFTKQFSQIEIAKKLEKYYSHSIKQHANLPLPRIL